MIFKDMLFIKRQEKEKRSKTTTKCPGEALPIYP
jgi:hypothetical protein